MNKLKKLIRKTIIFKKVREVLVKLYWNYTLTWMYPSIYKRYAKKSINEKKIVFIEVRMPEITDSFKLLYDRLQKDYDFDIHVHYLRAGFARKLPYMKLCKSMVKDIADAKYVFIGDASNITSCLPMRKETEFVQLWHACGAFKKFGMSTADLLFGDDRKTLEKHPYHKNYTLVIVSAPEVVWAYEEAMGLEKNSGIVRPLGVSRTDIFFDESFKEKAKQTLCNELPNTRDKLIICYAPTFRGRVARAKAPDALDIMQMKEKLGEKYVLLIKQHPFVKKPTAIPEGCENFAFDVTKSMTIEDLLFVSDVVISDYSSLVFEYSLFSKPMIFFAYDLDEYYDWRGFYYDYKDFVPGPIYTKTGQVIEYINNIDKMFDKKKVEDFCERFMSACDGHATERIMSEVLGL